VLPPKKSFKKSDKGFSSIAEVPSHKEEDLPGSAQK